MITNRKEAGGTLLILILVLFSALITTALAVGASSVMRYRHVKNEAEIWQARLWAESGLADAFNNLSHDPFFRADGSDSYPALHRKLSEIENYTVKILPVIEPTDFILRSIGNNEFKTSQVAQDAKLLSPFIFSLVAKEDIEINQNATVGGSVQAIESVRVYDQGLVTGNVQAGKFYTGTSESVSGIIYERLGIAWPHSSDEIKKAYTSLADNTISGGYLKNLPSEDGTLRILGSTDFRGTAERSGTVIVQGSLRLNGFLEIEAPTGYAALIVLGDLTVEEKGSLRVHGPIYVSGRFKNYGPCAIQGSVIARRISVGTNFQIRPLLETVYKPVMGFPHGVQKGRYTEDAA